MTETTPHTLSETLLCDTFLSEAFQRGLIKDCTDLAGLASGDRAPVTAYAGFDPTGASLHVGHLVPIMLLRLLQRHGHPVIALIGGATAQIGDPSDKTAARQLLASEAVQDNVTRVRWQLRHLLGPDTDVCDNADWTRGMDLVDFLREIGRHVPVNRLLSSDTVKRRLDTTGLSFLEFTYPLLQAHDFLHLSSAHGCRLQIGGSDQWGNILAGIDLIRRVRGVEAFGLTQPLVTTATGAKMGKTEQGAVFLDRQLTPDHDFFQFWRNVPDADVTRFLRLFTEIDLADIEAIAAGDINAAKKRLAFEVTAMVRGKRAAEGALETARRTFEDGGIGDDLPTLVLPSDRLAAAPSLADLVVELGFAPSRSAARRLMDQGGVRLDGCKQDRDARIDAGRLVDAGLRLSVGRKKHAVLKPA